MKRVSKRIISVVMVILLLGVMGITALAVDEPGHIQLSYTEDGTPLAGDEFRLYYIADYVDGEYLLLDEFIGCGVSFDGLSTEKWSEISKDLDNYIAEKGISPVQVGVTDTRGRILFMNLKGGLYLINGDSIKVGEKTYIPQTFCVHVHSGEVEMVEPKHDVEEDKPVVSPSPSPSEEPSPSPSTSPTPGPHGPGTSSGGKGPSTGDNGKVVTSLSVAISMLVLLVMIAIYWSYIDKHKLDEKDKDVSKK